MTLAVTETDWNILKQSLKTGLIDLKNELEDIYSNEFFRLTDKEEDDKHDALDQLQHFLDVTFGSFFQKFNLNPKINKDRLPIWLENFGREIGNNGGVPRTVFKITDQVLPTLQ